MDISSQDCLHFACISSKEVRADFTGGHNCPGKNWITRADYWPAIQSERTSFSGQGFHVLFRLVEKDQKTLGAVNSHRPRWISKLLVCMALFHAPLVAGRR